ncbi:alpha/beta hydrolase family protein [Paenibacillus sp. 22594]|uniref:alpha/beta hydrolase family protein n=1 Tax=Paenibacillus sp. 22594 TaxID=3453947 RepID=UPI003F829399
MNNSMRFSYGSHPSQFGVLHLPDSEGKLPVIITVHGGFWRSQFGLEETEEIVKDLVQRGFAVWNIEYRRIGEEGGGWKGTFSDAISAVNYISTLSEQFPLDLSRVMLLGHSAGGQLVLWLASLAHENGSEENFEPLLVSIRGVISLAGVSNLRKMWEIHTQKDILSPVESLLAGSPNEVPERYHLVSPMERQSSQIEQFLIHGEMDLHVPVEFSIEYAQKTVEQGGKAHLIVIPGIEHFQIINPTSSAWNTVIHYLKSSC